MSMDDPLVLKAYEAAKTAQSRAHAIYSNFKVGACVKMKKDDELYIGCNVENASIGNTVCAERNALNHSVALSGKKSLEFLIVVADTDSPTPPCGICLQSLCEFASPETPIYLANTKEIIVMRTFKELLPYSFTEF